MYFIGRFRIRRLLREFRAALTMAVGLYVSLALVFIAVDCYVMCRHVEVDNPADTHFAYMYMYKFPDRKVPEGGTPAFAKTLNKERFGYNLEVTLMGTDSENPYFDAVIPKGRKEVAISSARAQIKQAGHVFVDLMASMVYTMSGISGFIFFVVLYLMMGVMVDRASYDISLMKIFGYRRGEIRKLYLNGNMYFVALGSLVAIPLAKKTIDSIYPYFISNVACGMDLSMSPLVYVGLFAIIMAMYFVINALLVRKIDKVTPAEVLKNRE